jgi:cell division protein FtsQ
MLEPLGVTVAGVDLTPRGGWRLHASTAEGPLTLELGRDDASARLERFVAGYGRTLGALARAGTRIEHVDLRYRNGFAARVPGFRESTARKTP